MAKTPNRMDLDALSPIAWVGEERRRQHEARGEQNHSAYKWFAILSEEFGEVAKVLEHRQEGKIGPDEHLRELEYELIQTAAVAVAWVEAIRRRPAMAEPVCLCQDCPEVSRAGKESAKV